jgi:hypothetical protein
VIALLLWLVPCSFFPVAAGQVFECRDASGKVSYSTVPCSIQSRPAPSQAEASDYGSFYGAWHGQTEFKDTSGAGAGARSIAPLSLMIEEGGKVTGECQDCGCRIVGVARPGPLPTEPALDLTVSSCKKRAFNRRYTGTLALNARDRYARLHLVSLPRPLAGSTCDISGTLQR